MSNTLQSQTHRPVRAAAPRPLHPQPAPTWEELLGRR